MRAACTCAAALALALTGCGEDAAGPAKPSARHSVTVRVLRIVDGDTIEVSLGGEEEDVRYIGVDTPETVAPGQPVECFGHAASRFNTSLVEGERVRLTFDRERRDQYGRLLAYVYANGELVNAQLVRGGFARTLVLPPNTRHADLFARLQQQAADAGRGLWARC